MNTSNLKVHFDQYTSLNFMNSLSPVIRDITIQDSSILRVRFLKKLSIRNVILLKIHSAKKSVLKFLDESSVKSKYIFKHNLPLNVYQMLYKTNLSNANKKSTLLIEFIIKPNDIKEIGSIREYRKLSLDDKLKYLYNATATEEIYIDLSKCGLDKEVHYGISIECFDFELQLQYVSELNKYVEIMVKEGTDTRKYALKNMEESTENQKQTLSENDSVDSTLSTIESDSLSETQSISLQNEGNFLQTTTKKEEENPMVSSELKNEPDFFNSPPNYNKSMCNEKNSENTEKQKIAEDEINKQSNVNLKEKVLETKNEETNKDTVIDFENKSIFNQNRDGEYKGFKNNINYTSENIIKESNENKKNEINTNEIKNDNDRCERKVLNKNHLSDAEHQQNLINLVVELKGQLEKTGLKNEIQTATDVCKPAYIHKNESNEFVRTHRKIAEKYQNEKETDEIEQVNCVEKDNTLDLKNLVNKISKRTRKYKWKCEKQTFMQKLKEKLGVFFSKIWDICQLFMVFFIVGYLFSSSFRKYTNDKVDVQMIKAIKIMRQKGWIEDNTENWLECEIEKNIALEEVKTVQNKNDMLKEREKELEKEKREKEQRLIEEKIRQNEIIKREKEIQEELQRKLQKQEEEKRLAEAQIQLEREKEKEKIEKEMTKKEVENTFDTFTIIFYTVLFITVFISYKNIMARDIQRIRRYEAMGYYNLKDTK